MRKGANTSRELVSADMSASATHSGPSEALHTCGLLANTAELRNAELRNATLRAVASCCVCFQRVPSTRTVREIPCSSTPTVDTARLAVTTFCSSAVLP